MDYDLLVLTSVMVILLCILLSFTFSICCFCSPCPLYSMCRINYNYGDIVAFSKEDENPTLPSDDCSTNNYTPLQIKIKPVENV